MLKFEIRDLEVDVFSGTSRQSGRPFTMRRQPAFLELNGELRKVNVPLRDGQPPFPKGTYVLSDESFSVGQFGDLMIQRLVVVPVADSLKKAG